MRISFFFFSCLFGMRNHYSKYEITKGSCPPASCRREKDTPIFLLLCANSKRYVTAAFLIRVKSIQQLRPRKIARKEENRKDDNGRRKTQGQDRRHESARSVLSLAARGIERGKTYDKMSTKKKARKEKP